MKLKTIGSLIGAGILVAALALAGCSGASQPTQENTQTPQAGATEMKLVKDGTLTMLSSPDYPPFENLNEAGETVGFEVDLFKALAEQMGLKLEFVPLQFDAIIPAIVAGGKGDVGVSGFSVTPERAQEIDFTESFYIDDMAVAVMKNSSITSENAQTQLNAAGITIAVQTGTTGETFAKENFPNAKIQGYNNGTDCFAAMQSGQANAVCTNLSVVADMIANGYSDAHIVYKEATGEEYAAVVAKDNPGLKQKLNDAIAALRANGTLDELTKKYFG